MKIYLFWFTWNIKNFVSVDSIQFLVTRQVKQILHSYWFPYHDPASNPGLWELLGFSSWQNFQGGVFIYDFVHLIVKCRERTIYISLLRGDNGVPVNFSEFSKKIMFWELRIIPSWYFAITSCHLDAMNNTELWIVIANICQIQCSHF